MINISIVKFKFVQSLNFIMILNYCELRNILMNKPNEYCN